MSGGHQTPGVASADDERLGELLRAIRRRTGQTQRDLAELAGVPRRDVIAIERGEAGSVRLDRIRRVFAAANGRARLVSWWQGAAADRLVDERHAGLVERACRVLRLRAWEPAVEVTFSEYGERGSIDVLGARRSHLGVAVCEVKTAIGSLEELNRSLDAKVRLAPKLANDRFGFRPRAVGRILIVPDGSTVRRLFERHEASLRAVYPARSRAVRAWLRNPAGPISGVWFLSEVRDANPASRASARFPPRVHLRHR